MPHKTLHPLHGILISRGYYMQDQGWVAQKKGITIFLIVLVLDILFLTLIFFGGTILIRLMLVSISSAWIGMQA